jgi:hypothetical protein
LAKARLLLLGLDPDILDYSKSPLLGLTAAKVRGAVEADQAKPEAFGYTVKTLYVDDDKTAQALLADTRSMPTTALAPPRSSKTRRAAYTQRCTASAVSAGLVLKHSCRRSRRVLMDDVHQFLK